MWRSPMSGRLPEVARTLSPIFRPITSRLSSGITSGSCAGETRLAKGLVLGVFSSEPEDGGFRGNSTDFTGTFTKTAANFNLITHGLLLESLRKSGPPLHEGATRVFFGLHPEYKCVALVGMGWECVGYNENEQLDQRKEVIRNAAAIGCRALQELEMTIIDVEGFGCTEAAAEGAALGMWLYQELKHPAKKNILPMLELYGDCDVEGWQIGLHKAAAQNLARQLMDTPANIINPTTFAQNAVEVLCKAGVNVEVKVKGWAEVQNMGAFLSVAKGSCEQPIFLELSYYGADYEVRPIVLIGSGITFDSGGLCLKTPYEMRHMRANMAGAACVVAATRAVASLRLPVNIRGLIPLCENMPGCLAFKPGDVVTAMNGKKILIENTDCEGRLMLADTLCYSRTFWPKFVLDIGTLTRDVKKGLGAAATGVFTNSDDLWDKIRWAGVHTGDRMWRLPLWNCYTRQVTEAKSADMKNVGRGEGGGASKAAAFLNEFVACGEWIHLDTFGVMKSNGVDIPYLGRGMSGRPTRTLIEFISQFTCKECD